MKRNPDSEQLYAFGQHLKELRLKAGYGLRKFAGIIEMPASNLSATEHGRRAVPLGKIEEIAEAVGLEKGSDEWARFLDLGTQKGELPVDVKRIASRGFIPALLRTLENVQLTDHDIEKLVKEIKEGQ